MDSLAHLYPPALLNPPRPLVAIIDGTQLTTTAQPSTADDGILRPSPDGPGDYGEVFESMWMGEGKFTETFRKFLWVFLVSCVCCVWGGGVARG